MSVRVRSSVAAVTLAMTGLMAPITVTPAAAAPAAPTVITAETVESAPTALARKRYTVEVDKTRLRAKPGKRARFHISVAYPGAKVKIQTRTRKGWVTIASRALPKSSGTGVLAAEVWSTRRGTYTYRARVISKKADGTSPTITLTVR